MAPVNKSKAKAAKQKSEAAKKTQDEETIDEDVQGVLVVDNKATKGQKVTKVKVDPKSQPVFSLLCKYLSYFLSRPFLWLRGPSPPPLSQTPIKEEDAAHTLSVSSCFSDPCLRVPACPNSRLCFLECPEGASSRDAGTQGTSSRVASTQADDQLIPELVHPCMFCLTALKKF